MNCHHDDNPIDAVHCIHCGEKIEYTGKTTRLELIEEMQIPSASIANESITDYIARLKRLSIELLPVNIGDLRRSMNHE